RGLYGCRGVSVLRVISSSRGMSVGLRVLSQGRGDSVDNALKSPGLWAVAEFRMGAVACRDRDVGNLLGLEDLLDEAPASRAIGIAEEGMARESNDPPGMERDGEIGAAHGWQPQ